MKIKSLEKDVYFEKWKTPLADLGILNFELSGMLQTDGHTHFFFVLRDGTKRKKRTIHVMTIGRGWPLQLIEEGYAYNCLRRYLAPDPSIEKKVLDRKANSSSTWKLWGTSFIHELDRGKALSFGMGIPREEIFAYLIQTPDDWIEIVSPPPRSGNYLKI
jgi:hypothetical protein